MTLSCPRCRLPLLPAADGVDGCASCGGTFLHAALSSAVATLAGAASVVDEAAARTAASAATPNDARGDAACPVCAVVMRRHRFGLALEVDSCEHGTWFDRGEVGRLREAVARGVTAVAVQVTSSKSAAPTTKPTTKPSTKPPTKGPAKPKSSTTSPAKMSLDEAHAEADRVMALEQVEAMGQRRRLERTVEDAVELARHGRRRRSGLDEAVVAGLAFLLSDD